MIPAAFEYVAPETAADAVRELASASEETKVLAGGQSLLPTLRMRAATPSTVIDLGKIEELRGIRSDGDVLAIGSMTTQHEVQRNPLLNECAKLLALATATVADPHVRHRGTLGGALTHADPAGDLLAPTLALGAEMVIEGPGGRRTVPADEFFVDHCATAVGPTDVLVEVRVPKFSGWSAHYEKFTRVAQSWSIVAVATSILVEGRTITNARVSLTNMSSVPVRARQVERALIGQEATSESTRAAAQYAPEGTSAPVDGNANASYREHLAKVLTSRAVLHCT